MLLFSDVLYMLVRYACPSGPMCLRCLMLTLSGPVELLFLLCFIAPWTCIVVSVRLCGDHHRRAIKPSFSIVPCIVFLHH